MKLLTNGGHLVLVHGDHMNQHRDALAYLPEAISKLDISVHDLKETTMVVQIDMGRIIGKSLCVKTTDSDSIVYMRRIGRPTVTRFVKDRVASDTQFLTVVLKWFPNSHWFKLTTAWIGSPAEKEPGDSSITTAGERKRSDDFWSSHALVFGSQEVDI